jgi:hypothetical protein
MKSISHCSSRVSCIAVASLFIVALVLPQQAGAWGGDGHRIVAEVAERQLSAQAKSEVNRLLAVEPGATMVSVSTWADEHRSPATSAWHYVNLPRGGVCKYEENQSCPDGRCVVGAIERQVAILNSNASDNERLKALKYVIHFIADVHQPLHAGYADDRGGNLYQVRGFDRGTNLHSIWDSGLIANWEGGPSVLLDEVWKLNITRLGGLEPRKWAEESCIIVAEDDFYPNGHKITSEYTVRWSRTLVERLAMAANRLAMVLNTNLGTNK